MPDRLKRFSRLLSRHRLDGFLVTNDIDIRYLTGFPSSDSWLFVHPKKTVYLTDSRYTEQAKKALKGIKVECFAHSLPISLFDVVSQNSVKRLGFDDRNVSVHLWEELKKAKPARVSLRANAVLLDSLRVIKDAEEILQIRECLKLNLAAYRYITPYLRAGVTEKQLLWKLEQYVRSRGAGFSFPPIIASGPNAAYPHAHVTDRKLARGEPVLIDMGIEINGYKSDLTRMFFLGKITPLYARLLAAVTEAQNRAISLIRDGVRASDVDFAARNYLESLGLAKYFSHSLGHGVGLDIHESPRLSAKSGAVLREGMVVTVEPGVYLPNVFGIRLEEMVLVTKNGCEVLSRSR